MATHRMSSHSHKSREERIRNVASFSLRRRCMCSVLIKVFKMAKCLSGIDQRKLFSFIPEEKTWKHNLRPKRNYIRLQMIATSSSNGKASLWNRLSERVFDIPMLVDLRTLWITFQRGYTHSWNRKFQVVTQNVSFGSNNTSVTLLFRNKRACDLSGELDTGRKHVIMHAPVAESQIFVLCTLKWTEGLGSKNITDTGWMEITARINLPFQTGNGTETREWHNAEADAVSSAALWERRTCLAESEKGSG